MVKIRAAAVASVVVLLGTTFSTALADDSWGDMVQTGGNSATEEEQSTDAPANWDASKKSDDNQKSDDDQTTKDKKKSDDDTTDAPSTSWTPVPSNGDSGEDTTGAPSTSWTQSPTGSSGKNSWTPAPVSSGESSEKPDESKNDDDKSDTSPSTGDDKNGWTQAPTTSKASGNADEDDNGGDSTDGSTESTGTSTKQAPVASTGGSQTSQSTPSTSSGTVPDGTWPTSKGSVQFTAPRIIKSGEIFDGKMQTFDRSDITCSEGEGQKDTAVFLVEAGGTLKNAIIGKNQKEGVHCDDHDCIIENVWWDDVCEDALSIKGGTASSVTTVTNCGARSASDKVVQHNGHGTVNIDGFYAEDFGKLYRSCGTCGDIPRIVTVKNVYAVDPKVSVITVNKNYGDKATLSNIWVKTTDGSKDVKVCQWSQGSDKPSNLGDGPSPPLCQYSESDVHINQDISKAGGSSPKKKNTSSGPVTSPDGSTTSQTEWTQASTESSGDEDGADDNNKDAPAPYSGGSKTPGGDTSKDSQTTGGDDSGDSTTPSTGGGDSTTPSSGSDSSTPSTGGGDSTVPSSGGGKVPDGTWPTSTGTVQFAEVHVIKAGEVFDGKMQTFERSDVKCEGQTESGSSTAVFQLEAGATLKNAIIGKNQMEGVHCDKHDCTITNVWWDDVCEDALSIKGGTASSVSTVTGGGARSADDKVVQHNGYGTVKIDGFYGEDISKLYRSCGTCGDKAKKVIVSNVYIVNPDNAIVTVNKNWGDKATLSNIWVKSADDKVKICQWSQGNADGEPKMLGDGPSPPLCQYSESDVHINGDVSQATGGSTLSTGSAAPTSSDDGNSEQKPGIVSPASSVESSGDDDEDDSSKSTSQWTSPSATSSNGDDNNDDGGDDTTDGPSSSDDKKDKSGDKKSDGDNSDSTQQQETSEDDESVMQTEVGGEAGAWNETASTDVDADSATKGAAPSTTSTKKCNIRRKRK